MNYKSQWGQDKWVAELFSHKRELFFLDIGAYDGETISNTYYLEKELNWKGILIEPNPYEYNKLIKVRTNPSEQICISNIEGPVKFILNGWSSAINENFTDDEILKLRNSNNEIEIQSYKIETILNKHNTPKIIDYMSLDVEGGEFEILNSFPFNDYKIMAMNVEHNAHLGKKSIEKRQLIKELLLNHDYKFHHSYEADDFYIHISKETK